MPLSNTADTYFVGTLVEGLGDKVEEYLKSLIAELESREIPKVKIKHGTVNMWWRKDSVYIDVTSSLDGSITSTIHLQPYGRSLFIGRAFRSLSESNYYKRMANSAFMWTISNCVTSALSSMAEESAIAEVLDERPMQFKAK